MNLKRGTKKKLSKLVQILIGTALIQALDRFSDGNAFILVVRLSATVYIIYLVISLLYGRPYGPEEDE